MASIIATNFAFAADSYKNNVVDVKVNKEPGNAVKVTIYTDKPYTDPVVVNKKANNKYVILMPETNSSLKCSPSVSDVAGTVSNVSVNTQSVSGGKGYTKIIITSEKAITVVPRTQQLSSSSNVQSANKTTQKEAQAKKAAELKAQQEKAQKLAQEKAQKLAQEKAQKEAQAKKAAELKAQQEKTQKLAREKAQKEAQAKKAAELKAQQEKARRLAQEKAQSANKDNSVNKIQKSYNHPIEVLENEVKNNTTASLNQDISNDAFLNKEINDNLSKMDESKGNVSEEKVKPSVLNSIKSVLSQHEHFNLWKLLLLASAITFPIIVIMLILGMDKKINKRITQSFKKEEYQPMKSDVNYIQNEIDNNPSIYNTIDDMLDKVEEQTPSYHEEQIMRTNLEQKLSEVQDTINSVKFENDFESEDFNNNEVIDDTVPANIVNVVEDEHAKQVQDQIQPIEIKDNTEEIHEKQAEVLPPADYSPDGFLADFSNVNDKEFFDEIVIQSLADSNSNGLPEESPEDKIFDHINENIELTQNQNINHVVDDDSMKTISEKENESITKIEDVEDMSGNSSINEYVISNQQEVIKQQDVKEVVEEQKNDDIPDDENLVVLNQVEITKNSGLYLVDYDDFSSLVGYVNDDYFVIKKFAEHVSSNINIKPTEKLDNAMRYLVRVGKDKMIIEVNSTSMRRLLDL